MRSGLKTESRKEDSDPVDGIQADKHFTEAKLSLKHATSMYAVLNNPLIKDDFEMRTVEQVVQ